MKFLYTTIFIIAAFSMMISEAAVAQSSDAEITGKVTDSESKPIPNATVALMNTESGEIEDGTSTGPEGEFRFSATPGEYTLRVSYVSYDNVTMPLTLTAGEIFEAGTITLTPAEATLDELLVEGERSYMEMNFDSWRFNVGKDITSLGGSALDVLDNVPSITTDFEGNVSLRGNQGVQILINGRPSSLTRNGTDALSSIPANLIEEIEIITNPSARYAANGTAGIINIKLVDDVRLGFNGGVQFNTGYPQDHGLGANLNYHKNNINWFMNFDMEYENSPREGRTFQSFSGDTTFAYRERNESIETEREFGINVGADFFLPADQILTVESRVNIEAELEDTDLLYTDFDPGSDQVFQNIRNDWNIVQELDQNDVLDGRQGDYDFRVQYEKKFDDSEHRLTADADFEFGSENQDGELLEQFGTGVNGIQDRNNQRTFSDDQFRELRVDMDYRQPLGDSGRLEAGFRINYDWLEQNYRVEEEINGNWVLADNEVALSDNFRYNDKVNAAYASIAGDLGVFNYQFGVRAENTSIESKLTETGRSSDQNYTNLFPSAFLSYSVNQFNSFQVSYSRRISRPRIWWILPFTEISDVRTRRVGNPELRPEFGDSYEAGYLRIWESGSLLTSLYYRYRTDVAERITTIDGNGITTSQPINLATEKAWGIEFSADQELLNNLQLMASLNLFQANRDGEFEGVQYTSESESFTSRMRLRWRFADSWNFQANAFYRGAQQNTQGREDGSLFFGGALAKEFLDRRATISLNVRDLFNSRLSDREVINPNSFTQSRYAWSTRSIRLNFRYNFNSGASGGGGR